MLSLMLAIVDLKLHSNPPEDAWYTDIYITWLLLFIFPVHAFVITRRYDVNQQRAWYASWWGTPLCFVATFGSLIAIRAFYYEPYSMPSRSMSPTLHPSQHLIISKAGFGNYRYLGFQLLKTKPTEKPSRGDIIVFQFPQNLQVDYIKRVIGLPGDRIIYRNKRIYIKKACEKPEEQCPPYMPLEITPLESNQNSATVYRERIGEHSYSILIDPLVGTRASFYFQQSGTNKDEWVVPEEHYFVLGDNRDNSLDSRFWGFVPEGNIVGKLLFVW